MPLNIARFLPLRGTEDVPVRLPGDCGSDAFLTGRRGYEGPQALILPLCGLRNSLSGMRART